MPALNESANLAKLLPAWQEFLHRNRQSIGALRIIIVDDGSQPPLEDELSGAIAACRADGIRIDVPRFETNRGPGGAFKAAFRLLAESGIAEADWVVLMESDGTSPPDFTERLLLRADEGYDVVLASVYSYGGGFQDVSLMRQVASECAGIYSRVVLGVTGIWTLSSFFRLYRGRAILELQSTYGAEIVTSDGFDSMVELISKSCWIGQSISEVPFVVDQSVRIGKSRMSVLGTTRRYLSLSLRAREWRRASRLHR